MTVSVTFSAVWRAPASADSSCAHASSGAVPAWAPVLSDAVAVSSCEVPASAAAVRGAGTLVPGRSVTATAPGSLSSANASPASSAAPRTKSGCASTRGRAAAATAVSRAVSSSSVVAPNQSWSAAQPRMWASVTEALHHANTVARTSVAPHRATGSGTGSPSCARTKSPTWFITVTVSPLIPHVQVCCRDSRRSLVRTSRHRALLTRRGADMRMPRLVSNSWRCLGRNELKASSTMSAVRSFRAATAGDCKALSAVARPSRSSAETLGGDHGGPVTTR